MAAALTGFCLDRGGVGDCCSQNGFFHLAIKRDEAITWAVRNRYEPLTGGLRVFMNSHGCTNYQIDNQFKEKIMQLIRTLSHRIDGSVSRQSLHGAGHQRRLYRYTSVRCAWEISTFTGVRDVIRHQKFFSAAPNHCSRLYHFILCRYGSEHRRLDAWRIRASS